MVIKSGGSILRSDGSRDPVMIYSNRRSRMSLSSRSPGGRFASILPRDDSIFLRVDRIADNSEEADAICLFRRLIDETIEYKITRTKTAKSTPPQFRSKRDADKGVIRPNHHA